jgi:hypothetical protein
MALSNIGVRVERSLSSLLLNPPRIPTESTLRVLAAAYTAAVEVKLACPGETVILCHSADRGSKERAMHDISRRIEAALERLAARIARSKVSTRPR